MLGDLVRKNGWTSLWKGLVPTLLRDVPFSAIYWVSYETLKSFFSKSDRPTFAASFFYGATAGTVSDFIKQKLNTFLTYFFLLSFLEYVACCNYHNSI